MDKLKNVMKQNNGNVVIGAFEDDPALMNKEQYYAIRLPYEAFADGGAVGKEFFGTLRQIQELIRMLRNKEWTRQYYASTIAAFDEYHAGNLAAVHKVAGNMERLLTPVSELCRSAYLCDDARWYYTDQYGCMLPAKAEVVDVDQVLLQDGERYLRCAKFHFAGLSGAKPAYGWSLHNGYCEGFPYLSQYYEPGAVHMRLYVLEQEYKDVEAARRDMQTEGVLNYEQVSAELFSGC